MLSMADVEKARSIAERYSLSYFACCPLVFGHRFCTLRCNYFSETDLSPWYGVPPPRGWTWTYPLFVLSRVVGPAGFNWIALCDEKEAYEPFSSWVLYQLFTLVTETSYVVKFFVLAKKQVSFCGYCFLNSFINIQDWLAKWSLAFWFSRSKLISKDH